MPWLSASPAQFTQSSLPTFVSAYTQMATTAAVDILFTTVHSADTAVQFTFVSVSVVTTDAGGGGGGTPVLLPSPGVSVSVLAEEEGTPGISVTYESSSFTYKYE